MILPSDHSNPYAELQARFLALEPRFQRQIKSCLKRCQKEHLDWVSGDAASVTWLRDFLEAEAIHNHHAISLCLFERNDGLATLSVMDAP